MPAPPTRAEAMRRVNDALPAGLAVAWRPARRGDWNINRHWRVIMDGRQIAAFTSLEAAIFKATEVAKLPRFAQPSLFLERCA